MSTPAYPGRAIQFGETDADVVTPVQQRLIERGCGPLEITGVFDPAPSSLTIPWTYLGVVLALTAASVMAAVGFTNVRSAKTTVETLRDL